MPHFKPLLMKIFPTSNYEFELISDKSQSLLELEKNTLSDSSDSEKLFIGGITENGFKIISAKSAWAFCVFEGKLESQKGKLKIRIHKTFQIILSIIFLFPIMGFILALFTKEKTEIISLIFPTIISLVIFRFIFTELAFRIISKNGLKSLKKIMGITKLKKNEA